MMMQMTLHKIEGRYLTFWVGKREYGVEIHRVKEILGITALEPIVNTGSAVQGVLRIRGKVVPVVDLRLRLGLEETGAPSVGCVLTLSVKGWSGPLLMGLRVDGIREVVQIWTKNLEETPAAETVFGQEILMGVARYQERNILLLDTDSLAKEAEKHESNLSEGGNHEVY
jgi:purine-binding chemotaxis protein CheW